MTTTSQNGSNKSGAPPGNKNRFVHGQRSKHCATLGQGPKGCSYVTKLVRQMRARLLDKARERLQIAPDGDVPEDVQRAVNSACRWESHALYAQRALRQTANPKEWAEFSMMVASASEKRDAILHKLWIHDKADAPDAWEAE